ncbi:hypothetical protein Tco_1438378 [Tanacetum coccineum]
MVVDRWSGGGQRRSAAVDCRWPPLTAVDWWSDGGSGDGDGTVIMPRGTNHMVTRGLLMIDSRLCRHEVWYEVQVRWRLVHDLEGHVEVAGWWIGWRTMNADPSQSLVFIESVECSDEFIKCSVEDIVPIPSESEDTSESDSDCDLPSCDDFSPINVYEEKFVTFSNPLFNSNDDFTSSDDESLSDEDVPEDNVKIYSNPLFEFDDEYISSDVNPLFDEVLENIESKDSYVSNHDDPALLVTPLSDDNEDECFDPGGDVDEIEFQLHRDSSTPTISIVSILEGFIDEPTLKENDDLFDLESKDNEWKKILYDDSIDDLMTEDKIFDPGIPEKFFSPTYVKLPFEDRHYLSFTYVIRIFLPYFTYPVESPFLLSSGSEDTIFDLGIPVFSLEPVVSHRSGTFMCFNVYLNILNESPIEICSSTCFVPNISMIWGESS